MRYLALLLLLCASVAKADGFNPSELYPGKVVFDFSTFTGVGQISWSVAVIDDHPAGPRRGVLHHPGQDEVETKRAGQMGTRPTLRRAE